MVGARSAARGLSGEDLGVIEQQLAAGRKPKVVFTQAAGQIAGQLGQVVRLADPAEGEEWVVVRFGRDELPFSPADLALAPKGASARRVADRSVDEPVGVEAGASSTGAVSPAVADGGASGSAPPPLPTGSGSAAPPVSTGAAAAEPVVSGREGKPVAAPPPVPAGGDEASRGQRRGSVARKAAKPKPVAGLTVTLSYVDGEWFVAAQQGAKVLAKPYVVRAAEALKMVALLDVPGVQEAVEGIVSAARAQAELQAQRLREELAEVEERLAELRVTP